MYDRNNNVITYYVDENTQKYGYERTGTTCGTYTENFKNQTVVNSYTITNELPVTYLKVKKSYVGNETYNKYVKSDDRDITFDITRTVDNSNYDSVLTNQLLAYTNNPGYWTTEPVLVCNIDNDTYTYKVSEHDVQGYTTAYSYSYTAGDPATTQTTIDGTIPAETATSDSPLELTITNTAITGSASVVKIDKTFYDKYNTHSDYQDITIAGAKFNLYINTGTEQLPTYMPVYVKQNAEYKYTIDETSPTSCEVISDANGKIEFVDMPLNTYYLKETSVDTSAYKIIDKNTDNSDVYYKFTIDVNGASSTTADNVTYTAETNAAVGFIGKDDITKNKIGNPEVVHQTSAELTKVDAVTNTAITASKATYYLLERIPYSVHNPGITETNENDYNAMSLKVIKGDTTADPAIPDCGGKYTEAVALYWRKIGEYQTDDTGKIKIPANTLSFNTYTFLEVQAPVGYDRSYDGFTVKNANNAESDSMTFTISSSNYKCEIVHSDPRRDAKVKIYKQDEFENPLNGATFDLYYVPDRYEGQTTHRSSEDSDFNYIFFTDNMHYDPDGEGEQPATLPSESAWGTVYAYFFNDSGAVNGAFPGTEQTSYWINDDGDKVYKVIPPDEATGVVFNNNNNGKKTEDIKFTLGNGYYKVSKNQTGDIYYVNYNGSVSADTEKAWLHAQKVNGVTVTNNQYDTYGECVYIKNDTTMIGEGNDWDDLHIYFMNDDNQIVAQNAPGYSPSHAEEITGISTYKVEIPVGATKFVLNNGNKGGFHARNTVAVPIEPNAGYSITNDKEGSNYKVKLWGRNLNADNRQTDLNADPAPFAWTTPIKIATVETGDDGLPESVTVVNNSYAKSADSGKSVELLNWGSYYWTETTSPTGYNAGAQTQNIAFSISATEADKVVNVYKADNERIKGKVTLTKTAQEKVGDIDIGGNVPNAVFELYKSDGTKVNISVDNSGDSVYNVNSSGTATLTTDSNGRFTIQELDWGQYYLQEVSAPTGFAVNSNKIYFTVGRNNCGDTPQQLTIKDPAAKAKIKLTKTIDDRVEAWGDPTFIFKIRQTESYGRSADTLTSIDTDKQPVKIVSLTLDSGLTKTYDVGVDDQGYFEVDPGTYVITEVSVARYEFDHGTVTVNNGDADSFTNGTADVLFDNHVKYYDKFSHVDCEVNKFHGYKGIRVEYNNAVPVGTDPATINKTALDVYKIMSNGKEVKLDLANNQEDAAFMNGITYTYVHKDGDDSRFGQGTTPDFSVEGNQIKITNPSRYTDSVYTLKAHDNNSGFECDFDISFVSKNQQPKEYEKTVVFKADNDNKSYFFDEGVRTSQYALTFTMVKNSSNQYEVYCVKHNGKVLAYGTGVENAVNGKITDFTKETDPVLTVNEAYAYTTTNTTGLVFDKWNDLSSVTYSTFSGQLINNDNSSVITYTAKLKTKS